MSLSELSEWPPHPSVPWYIDAAVACLLIAIAISARFEATSYAATQEYAAAVDRLIDLAERAEPSQ